MVETMDVSSENSDTWMRAKKNIVNSVPNAIARVKAIAAKETHENTVDFLLNIAGEIAEKKLPYALDYNRKVLPPKYPKSFVCDTFIKYLYNRSDDPGLKSVAEVWWAVWWLYNYFSPPKTNMITSSNISSFKLSWTLTPGDLMFFQDVTWKFGHVALYSRTDSNWDIYIYDASGIGVRERKLRPNELHSIPRTWNYNKIYFGSPVPPTMA